MNDKEVINFWFDKISLIWLLTAFDKERSSSVRLEKGIANSLSNGTEYSGFVSAGKLIL